MLEELLENFEYLENWEERYKYIIDLGRKLPNLDDDLKNNQNKVNGCTSQVWMVCQPIEENEGKLVFNADSDAHIVRGLIALILSIYSGKTPKEILDVDSKTFFEKLGLLQHLSPNRANGLNAMVERIKFHAVNSQS